MDVSKYIESGILESYLLGEVTEQEIKEVECLAKIYPEVRLELSRHEDTLELMANKLSRPLPDGNKEAVLTAITGVEQIQANSTETKTEGVKTRPVMWIAAGSVAIAITTGFLFVNTNSKYKDVSDSLATEQIKTNHLLDQNRKDSLH